MYPITNQSLLSILSKIIILLIIQGSYCNKYENCSQPFQCGSIKNISYPFWGGSHSVICGYPGFKLFNCQGDVPLIRIDSRTYKVLEINYTTGSLRVARHVLGNNSTSQSLRDNTILNSKLFVFPTSDKRTGHDTETGNLVMTEDQTSERGDNITCNNNFPVPKNVKLKRRYPVKRDRALFPSPSSTQENEQILVKRSGGDQSFSNQQHLLQGRRWLAESGLGQSSNEPAPSPLLHRGFAPADGPAGSGPTPTLVLVSHDQGGVNGSISVSANKQGLSLGTKIAIGGGTTGTILIAILIVILKRN